MDQHEFLKRWQLLTNETVPISHYLKDALPDRWLGIHSLPESKRYPSDAQDWATLLERQNTVATELLGEDTDVYLLAGDYDYPEDLESADLTLSSFDSLKTIDFQPLVQLDLHALDPDNYPTGLSYQAQYALTKWSPGQVDAALRDIALDELRIMWVCFERGVIFAPYDGGVDLILPEARARNHFRSRYSAWLSPRPDGK
jgi:hypothetical protein